MSAAAASEGAPRKGSKKLILIGSAVVLLLVLAGAAAFLLLQNRSGLEDEDAEQERHEMRRGGPPVFLPLETFTVNLADREEERYAQVGITLQLDDAKSAERFKTYMPAIRHNILMVLSQRSAAELLSREGKEKLAQEIAREAVRPMGIEIEIEPEDDEAAADDTSPKKRKKPRRPVHNPVQQVHFSNFIVQ